MAQLQIHPRHAERLRPLGLQRPEDFLALRGVIVSGHPDRHVQQVTLAGYGRLFLKKEHRIQLAHRWESWWRGHGAVSLSGREFTILCRLASAGLPCPEPVAAGESGGRAFLLLREVENAVELRRFLQQHPDEPTRRQVAAALGQQLARMHAAGFDHPDLYSKHVLVQDSRSGLREGSNNSFSDEPYGFLSPLAPCGRGVGGEGALACIDGSSPGRGPLTPNPSPPEGRGGKDSGLLTPSPPTITLLDWQRSQCRQRVSLRLRCRDLAALDATLAKGLASPRDRLRCLASYLRTTATLLPDFPIPEIHRVAVAIQRRSVRLQQLRRVQELCRPPLPEGSQELLWLDGEALCVTRRFHEQLGGNLPPWLGAASQVNPAAPDLAEQEVALPDGGRGQLLVRQQATASRRWWQRGRPHTPELAAAAALFRLQRQGVPAPTLLAFGQRQTASGLVSFLLLEASAPGTPLSQWLATQPRSPQRRAVLRQLAEFLRGVQQAGYQVGEGDVLVLTQGERGTVTLKSITTLKRVKTSPAPTVAVLALFLSSFRQCSYWERHYFWLHYLNLRRLPDRTRHLALAVQERAAQTSVRSHA